MDMILDKLLIATLGILLGAWLSNFFQTRRILKEQKVSVLRDLMATRFDSPFDQKAAESINFIPVLFASSPKVLKSYADYHDALHNKGKDVGYKFNGLVAEIAKDVKISFGPLDLMRTAIVSHETVMKIEKFQMESEEWKKKYKDWQKAILQGKDSEPL